MVFPSWFSPTILKVLLTAILLGGAGQASIQKEVAQPIAEMPVVSYNFTIPKQVQVPVISYPVKTVAKQNTFFEQHYWGKTTYSDCKVRRIDIRNSVAIKWISIVGSGSMIPCIDNNIHELAIAWSGYPYENLQIGDIVQMRLAGVNSRTVNGNAYEFSSVMHRIVAKTENGFITKGDNAVMDDVYGFGIYLTKDNYAGLVVDAR